MMANETYQVHVYYTKLDPISFHSAVRDKRAVVTFKYNDSPKANMSAQAFRRDGITVYEDGLLYLIPPHQILQIVIGKGVSDAEA